MCCKSFLGLFYFSILIHSSLEIKHVKLENAVNLKTNLIADVSGYFICNEDGVIKVDNFTLEDNEFHCTDTSIKVSVEYDKPCSNKTIRKTVTVFIANERGCLRNSEIIEDSDQCPSIKRYYINTDKSLVIMGERILLTDNKNFEKQVLNYYYSRWDLMYFFIFFGYFNAKNDNINSIELSKDLVFIYLMVSYIIKSLRCVLVWYENINKQYIQVKNFLSKN